MGRLITLAVIVVVAILAFIFRANIKNAVVRTHKYLTRKKIERQEIASKVFNNSKDRQLVGGYTAKRLFNYGKKAA